MECPDLPDFRDGFRRRPPRANGFMTGGSGTVWNWALHTPIRKGTCQGLDRASHVCFNLLIGRRCRLAQIEMIARLMASQTAVGGSGPGHCCRHRLREILRIHIEICQTECPEDLGKGRCASESLGVRCRKERGEQPVNIPNTRKLN